MTVTQQPEPVRLSARTSITGLGGTAALAEAVRAARRDRQAILEAGRRALEGQRKLTAEAKRAVAAATYEMARFPQEMVRVPAKPKAAPEPESQKEFRERMAERHLWYV
ncbi:MAG: hypothetical protein OXM58_12300 [Rhodospirillaceae bacterium]|nr:hypothetical protein [Rhodospirillaceae bacterium]MDE0149143.1 hypothetical protein [Rhodospirillaceae bacterium]